MILKPEDLLIKYEAGEYRYQSNAIKAFTIQFELGPIHNEWALGTQLPEYDITVEFNGEIKINVSSEEANTWAEFREQSLIRRDKFIAFKTGLNWLLNSDEDLADDLMQKAYYEATIDGLQTIMIEGDGRDLSFLEDDTVDCIITDYPWTDKKAHKGGSRNFASSYEGLQYCQADFNEKARVLKPGSFLVEFMPLESESNWQELACIKQLAINAGLNYYAKVPYLENRVRNTGRTSKVGGDILVFTKGKARALRPDAKKNKAQGISSGHYMSGASRMLPVQFDAPLSPKKELRHQSMKSLELIKILLGYFTKAGDLVLDQFSGSFVTSLACDELNRCSIGIEKAPDSLEGR